MATLSAQPRIETRTLNKRPSDILNRVIEIETFNGTTNQVYDEGYEVVPHNLMISLGNGKYKINIGGNYVLKFTMPQAKFTVSSPSSTPQAGITKTTATLPISTTFSSPTKMYITFAAQNSNYVDGYEDYKTAIPLDYINTLKNWLYAQKFGSAFVQANGNYNYKLSLLCKGNLNGDPSVSLLFDATFFFTIGLVSIENPTPIMSPA